MTKAHEKILREILYHPPVVTTASGTQVCVYCLIDVYDRDGYATDLEHVGNCSIGKGIKLESEPDKITVEALEGLAEWRKIDKRNLPLYGIGDLMDKFDFIYSLYHGGFWLFVGFPCCEPFIYLDKNPLPIKTLTQLKQLLQALGVSNDN